MSSYERKCPSCKEEKPAASFVLFGDKYICKDCFELRRSRRAAAEKRVINERQRTLAPQPVPKAVERVTDVVFGEGTTQGPSAQKAPAKPSPNAKPAEKASPVARPKPANLSEGDGAKRLGKYEIRRVLGKGAMGVVYEGFDTVIERVVAIKTIRKELLDDSEDTDVLERFKREARAGGRLNHPNIVGIYDYGEDAETAFIAMEFIKGKELKEMFDDNMRFELQEVIGLISQLLEALDYSHTNGVVHRDIKPANIILMSDGKIKVTDFGIARIESSTLTQAGSSLGTPGYMSPEQFSGENIDSRTDIFSAGVILYQFLTGEKPFTGSTITSIMHKVMNFEPDPPSSLNPNVPSELDDVVMKAIAKNLDERYQTAREFLDDMRAATAGKTATVGRADDKVREARTSAADEATIITSNESAPKREPTIRKAKIEDDDDEIGISKTQIIIGLVIAVVIFLAVGAFFMFSSGKEEPPTPPAKSGLLLPASPARSLIS